MSNRFTATLPTGKQVVIEELDTEQQMTALAAGSEHLTQQQAQFAATLESLRFMVKATAEPPAPGQKPDFRPVAYADLEGKKINDVFNPKEINGLMIAYGEIMGATDHEKKAILASLKLSSGTSSAS